ncbi:hypothetical protein DFH11DRAFT_1570584 [Phellopilus nigrolimitatus]|nr:hypothetical protein DFH11DRAFT_1570584 [Phellopilus nigrolimitatus]
MAPTTTDPSLRFFFSEYPNSIFQYTTYTHTYLYVLYYSSQYPFLPLFRPSPPPPIPKRRTNPLPPFQFTLSEYTTHTHAPPRPILTLGTHSSCPATLRLLHSPSFSPRVRARARSPALRFPTSEPSLSSVHPLHTSRPVTSQRAPAQQQPQPPDIQSASVPMITAPIRSRADHKLRARGRSRALPPVQRPPFVLLLPRRCRAHPIPPGRSPDSAPTPVLAPPPPPYTHSTPRSASGNAAPTLKIL